VGSAIYGKDFGTVEPTDTDPLVPPALLISGQQPADHIRLAPGHRCITLFIYDDVQFQVGLAYEQVPYSGKGLPAVFVRPVACAFETDIGQDGAIGSQSVQPVAESTDGVETFDGFYRMLSRTKRIQVTLPGGTLISAAAGTTGGQAGIVEGFFIAGIQLDDLFILTNGPLLLAAVQVVVPQVEPCRQVGAIQGKGFFIAGHLAIEIEQGPMGHPLPEMPVRIGGIALQGFHKVGQRFFGRMVGQVAAA